MAADSLAEKMLMKLLLQNRMITKSQLKRIIEKHAGVTEKTLHEVIVENKFVDPAKMKKILDVIEKKKVNFPLLKEPDS